MFIGFADVRQMYGRFADLHRFAKVRESSREFATVDADAPTDRRRIDDRFAD